MTTEVLAALQYGPHVCACPSWAHPPDPYFEGEDAREASKALLSNPYAPGSTSWHNWRSGWMRKDIWLGSGFHRVSS